MSVRRAGETAWSGGAIRLATRKSELALWQANWVRSRLEELGATVELVPVVTQGDTDGRPFDRIEGQGFFTKAVQDALLDGRAHLAVHSFKDLPSAGHPLLEIAAVPDRADPRDVLLIRPEAADEESLASLPAAESFGESALLSRDAVPLRPGAKVGTSAARRRKQLQWLRPDLELADLRGNVPTRISKLRAGDYDAIVLAAAGLARIRPDTGGLHTVVLEPELLTPAPAQGALALEIRRSDFELASLLTELHSLGEFGPVSAERGLMAMLQGGCQLALGAHARSGDGVVRLRAWYEGSAVESEHATPEGAAMLAFDALGRPDGAAEREARSRSSR